MWNVCCLQTWLVGCTTTRRFAILLFSNSDVNREFPSSMDLKLEFCNIEKVANTQEMCPRYRESTSRICKFFIVAPQKPPATTKKVWYGVTDRFYRSINKSVMYHLCHS